MKGNVASQKAAIAALGVGALLLSFAAPAYAAGAGNENEPEGVKQCIIVLEPLEPGQTDSEVETRTCSTGADFAAKSDIAAQSTLLMTWYANSNYGGVSTQIRGKAGPCDSSGYGFRCVGDAWNDRISSFRTFNYCNAVEEYRHANYGGIMFYLSNPGSSGLSESYLGSGSNQVSSFWLKRV
ncbi:hypothetical protein L7D48_05525 [Streptomyces sp. S1A]|uniref:hypothetical protein n=1 Tax=Streptomyces sp. ICN903 TaxID=2964654 RepID=UPI001ED9F591|nr:hypothetical protein [Streptomyces sp. ICN903]MCG3040032.1 hypothetical protein [Streptomyces sp. ICN903]